MYDGQTIIIGRQTSMGDQLNIVDKLENSGAYFKQLGEMQFKRGYYHIITPINFKILGDFLDQIKIDSRRFFGVYKNIQENVVPYPHFSYFIELNNMLTHTSEQIFEEIKRVEAKFKSLGFAFHKQEFSEGRDKRGLLDIAGKAMKFLFGVATSEDVEKVRTNYQRNQKGLVDMLHAEQKLVTAVKLQHTQLNNVIHGQEILRNVTNTLASELENQIIKSQEYMKHNTRNYLRQRINQYHTRSLVTINAISEQINMYFAELTRAMNGKLSPLLIDPRMLEEMLKEIAKHLPRHLIIPPIDEEDELADYYSLIKPDLISMAKGKKVLVLKVPIMQEGEEYDMALTTVIRLPLVKTLTSTSKIELQNNKVYASHKQIQQGYVMSLEDLTKCDKWGKTYICETVPIYSVPLREMECFNSLYRNSTLLKPNCEVKLNLDDEISQVDHLIGNTWSYSVREEIEMWQDCRDGNRRKKILLQGVGRMELTGGCTFTVGEQEINTDINLKTELSKEITPMEGPLQIMEHLLAASFPWEELKAAKVGLPNVEVLQKVKDRLNRLIPLQKNETSISSKTRELLNLTSNLLMKKEEDLLIPTTVFMAPNNNDYLEYAIIVTVVLLLIALIMQLQRRERRINEEIVDSLKRVIEAKVNELK